MFTIDKYLVLCYRQSTLMRDRDHNPATTHSLGGQNHTLADGHTGPSKNAVTPAASIKVEKLMGTESDRIPPWNIRYIALRLHKSLDRDAPNLSVPPPRVFPRNSSSINETAKISRYVFEHPTRLDSFASSPSFASVTSRRGMSRAYQPGGKSGGLR